MKKLIPILFLFFSPALFAQNTSISIGTTNAKIGDTVFVPINCNSLFNVGAISLKIEYNDKALTFLGVVNSPSGVTFISHAVNGEISFGWYDASASTPFPVSYGKVADLLFVVSDASELSFNTAHCELMDESGNILAMTYLSGAITL